MALEKKFPAGKRLEELRVFKGLSQEVFAKELHVTQPAVSLYKKGGQVDLAVVNRACERFKCSERWLKYGDGEMFDERGENAPSAQTKGQDTKSDDVFANMSLAQKRKLAREMLEQLFDLGDDEVIGHITRQLKVLLRVPTDEKK